MGERVNEGMNELYLGDICIGLYTTKQLISGHLLETEAKLEVWSKEVGRKLTLPNITQAQRPRNDQARKSVLGDDGNRERILNAFYPLNASSPHLVWVLYYINGSNITSLDFQSICHQLKIPFNASDINTSHAADYVFVLADQPILLSFDINLLFTLVVTLHLIIKDYGTCPHLMIDPLCNGAEFHDQLALLTSWVSECFSHTACYHTKAMLIPLYHVRR